MSLSDYLEYDERTYTQMIKALRFESGHELSVQASSTHYCKPRVDDLEPDGYESYELALFDPDGEWVTEEVLWQYGPISQGCCNSGWDRMVVPRVPKSVVADLLGELEREYGDVVELVGSELRCR